MTKQKRILHRAKISERKFREIVKYFAYDLEAKKTAELLGLNRKTVNRYYRKIREAIANYQEQTTQFSGEIELDESYFGGKRKGKDKRGDQRKKRCLSSASRSEMEKYIHRSSKTLQNVK